MASIRVRGATVPWPPDDTEESILGVDRHQLDIFSLRGGINEEAHRRAAATGGPIPWQAITQIMLLGCRRRDGSSYTTYPDVMVFPRPMSIDRGSYNLHQDGPPVLIVEVASESTYRVDLDVTEGKAWSYAQAGVREYLVLDPTNLYVPEGGRGWRLPAGARLATEVYRPWPPDASGLWRSDVIGVAIGLEGGLAAVYGADGRRKLREGEIEATVEALRAEGQALRAEGQALRAEGLRRGLEGMLLLKFGEAARPLIEAVGGTMHAPTLEAVIARLPGLTSVDEARALLTTPPASAGTDETGA